uniref:PH domain-containing protein n=1 Tax=Minutocellus polymorphus TaxID=265543 RepID=A0A7S0AM20_9STRA|mmetsp:Transcript_17602/g.29269  ORF Transcript_17602/g.29269 Transcript_17602/m.29269 type:complete len:249 (+) Transcript_17602:1-747(+)|eukprot:CAMPEP_0197725992 /NCGR_PEP_ID=MMETSP1434-20131217/12392_1 /TAXON_ID=265543 /ORGANISM="Minutocellus polymorphus, Strain CCMP3303" /LENGTH=248 /DNA_ID=CAMNT_0043311761 /DNA_START=1 /DNA_END=747 /DNA_ORIENTATION=-
MTTIELRRRPNAATPTTKGPSPPGGDANSSLASGGGGRGLSARVLLNSSPAQEEMVLKLHVPALYPFVPSCLQRVLSSRWLRVLNLYPRWTERHLILIGKYLYRFTDDNAAKPKGAPVPVEAINTHVCAAEDDDDMDFIWDHLPPGCDSIFTVSTFGKTQYFAVTSREDANTWVNSLREARQSAITRSMGHASHVPYPAAWQYIDSLGVSLARSKDRIHKKLAESKMKQMDIGTFGDVAGPMPRGYYG